MDELITLATRALTFVDNKMGQYWSQLAATNVDTQNMIAPYERAKRDLNDALRDRMDFSIIYSATLHYLSLSRDNLEKHPISIDNGIEHSRRATIEAVGDFITRLTELAEFDSHKSSIRNDLQLLKKSLESQRVAVNTLEAKLAEITQNLQTVYGPAQRQYEELHGRLDEDLKHIDRKRKEIDALSGLVTGKAITSSYQRSAISEKKNADYLRYASLVCMLAVIIVAAISFYFATTAFDLGAAIVRLAFAILLSIPAAYLARESAKHRKQQYSYLQTALDIKAITPYSASLPLETQHKLKEEMASRIFASHSLDHILNESFPLNLQDVIIAALNAGKSKDKSKNDEAGDSGSKKKVIAMSRPSNKSRPNIHRSYQKYFTSLLFSLYADRVIGH